MYKNQIENVFSKTPEKFTSHLTSVLASLPETPEEESTFTQKMTNSKKNAHYSRYKFAAACATFAFVIVSIPVTASVISYRKQRMEQMPVSEQKQIASDVQNMDAEAFSYSRNFSKDELQRKAKLSVSYDKKGTFPKKNLLVISKDSEKPKNKLCFQKKSGMFFLPNHSLTDEELLEIIDYEAKQQYSIETEQKELYDNAEKSAQEIRQKIINAGGLDEEKAISESKKHYKKLLNTVPKKVFTDVEYENLEDDISQNNYTVTFTDENGTKEEITLNAASGNFVSYAYVDALFAEPGKQIKNNQIDNLDVLQKKALALTNKLSDFSVSSKYAYFIKDANEKLAMDEVNFVFRSKDNQGLIIAFRQSDEKLLSYSYSDNFDEDFADEFEFQKDHAKVCNETPVKIKLKN